MSPFCVLRFVSPCSLFLLPRIFFKKFRVQRPSERRFALGSTCDILVFFDPLAWTGAEPCGARRAERLGRSAGPSQRCSGHLPQRFLLHGAPGPRAKGGPPPVPTSVSQWLPRRVRPPLPPWAVASAAPQFASSQGHHRDTRCGCRRAALRRPAPCSAPGHNGGSAAPAENSDSRSVPPSRSRWSARSPAGKSDPVPQPAVVVFRPRRRTSEPPVVFWQIFPPQVHIRRFMTGDLLPPQFLHQPVLMRAVHPLDSSLGFRRTRCDHRDPQLRAHAPKLRDRFFPS